MFMKIDNRDMSVNDVEKLINDVCKVNDGVILPKFALEILSKTNHITHIKKILNNIKEKCDTPEKMAPYREFILSCVDGREMSPQALDMLDKLAALCGCSDEFEEAKGKPKLYGKFDCKNTVIVRSEEEFEELIGENFNVHFDIDTVDLSSLDLRKVENIKFREGAEVTLSDAENLPKSLDVSMCSKVNLFGCDLSGLNLKFREGAEVNLFSTKNLPKDLDVSMCSKVVLGHCDLSELNLKFREGAEVNLDGAKNLPKDLDFSPCSKVDLSDCDLEGLKLKFKEGAEVNLSGCKNLPKDLDLSMCSKVDLRGCDLSGLNLKFREGAEVNLGAAKNLPKDLDFSQCSKVALYRCDLSGLNLKFREGAEVNFGSAKNLPKDLDVSMCSRVDFRWCDLRGLNLKFREGAVVNLDMSKNLQKDLDVSMCSNVDLYGCDLSGVMSIKFANMAQKYEAMKMATNFEGKVVYASIFSRIRNRLGTGGAEM